MLSIHNFVITRSILTRDRSSASCQKIVKLHFGMEIAFTGSMPTPLETSAARLPALDGLRGVAILGVLFSKAQLTPGFPSEFHLRWGHIVGSASVDLFFVVSGYLITMLLLAEKDRNSQISLGAFYWRRALRIVPAFLALLTALWLLDGHSDVEMRHIDWLSAATYTVNFIPESSWDAGHLWSLSIEEHFYLLWPLMVVLLSESQLRKLLVALIVGTLLLRGVVLAIQPREASILEVWTIFRWDTIAAGCWLALGLRHEATRTRLMNFAGSPWALPATIIILIVSLGLNLSDKLGLTIGYSLTAIAWAALILLALQRSSSLPRGHLMDQSQDIPSLWIRVLQSRFLVTIGILSYSLYLWHRLFLRAETNQSWLYFPVNLACLTLAAVACHWLIERPFLLLKNSWKTQPATEQTLPWGSSAPVDGLV